MQRRVLSILLAAVLLAGCTVNQPGKAPDQVTSPGTAEPTPSPDQPGTAKVSGPLPKILHAEMRFSEDYPGGGAMLGANTLVPGDNIAPADDFLVSIQLAPSPDASWFEAVKYEGSTDPPYRANWNVGLLEFRVGEGQPGDVVTVTLPPLEGTEQTVYRFKRTPTPTVKLEVNQNGTWEPAAPHLVYPHQNLKLRLTFSSPMDRAVVEKKLREPSFVSRHPLMDRATYTWQDESTLIIQFAEAPPVIHWSLVGSYDQKGLYLIGPIPAVHTGAAPYLAAVDPVTGKETRLRDVVPQAISGMLAMGGQKLLLTAYDLMGGQYSFTQPHFWLMDLKAGTTQSIAWDWTAKLVGSTGEVKVYKYENDGKYDQGPISPDGSQWIFYRLPEKAAESGQIFEVGIEIRTPDGKLIKALGPAARVLARKYGYGRPETVWAPDGKSVIFTSDTDRQQTELIHVNLTTGASRKVATVPAFANPFASGPLLQWQAGRAAAGPTIVDVASGNVIRAIEGGMASRFLGQDGKYLLFAQQSDYGGDWGPISVVSIDTGKTMDLGEGLPVGWSTDGKALVVRWDAYEYRYVPQGL